MSEQININVIAYLEEPRKYAEQIATFANESLYAACVPVIEAWIAEYHSPEYLLTESCELDISVEVET